MQKKYRRVVQIELNEISSDIIRKLIGQGRLPNFQKIQTDWSYIKTRSETQYERIEPWIQWVTAHTGKSYDEHGIFRLGDVDQLQHPQIWEILAEHGMESAVLGCMNASRGQAQGFFFPDPWAKHGEAWPRELQPLWNMISNKVQGHSVSQPQIGDLLKAFQSSARLGISTTVYAKVAKQFIEQKINPLKKWKLAALFDEFLGDIFLGLLANPRYRFCSIFLNAIAHYQHHYWRNFDRERFARDIVSPDCAPDDDPIRFGYQTYDRILGRILQNISLEDTLVIIASGLSQIPYTQKEQEGGMNYYRLKDHQGLLQLCGLGEAKAFPMMSRDWQVSAPNLDHVEKQLANLEVDGEKLFAIDAKDDGFLFLETRITRQISSSAVVRSGERVIGRFHALFVNIAIKSGHHTGIGSLWVSDYQEPPQSIPLTQVFDISRSALLA